MVPRNIEAKIKFLFAQFDVVEKKIETYGATVEEISITAFPDGYNPPYKFDELIDLRQEIAVPGNFLGNSARFTVSSEGFHKIKYLQKKYAFPLRRAYASDVFSLGQILLMHHDPCAINFFQEAKGLFKEIYKNFCKKDAENAATVGRAYAQLSQSILLLNSMDDSAISSVINNAGNSVEFIHRALDNIRGSGNPKKVNLIIDDAWGILSEIQKEAPQRVALKDSELFMKHIEPLKKKLSEHQKLYKSHST